MENDPCYSSFCKATFFALDELLVLRFTPPSGSCCGVDGILANFCSSVLVCGWLTDGSFDVVGCGSR